MLKKDFLKLEKMWILTWIVKQIGIFLVLAFVVDAGEYCRNKYSQEEEYCDGYCCSTEDDNCCSDWGWIAGVVVGCIVFFAIVGTIIFLVCQKMNTKKRRTVNVQMSNNYQSNYRNNTRRQQVNYNSNQNSVYTTHMSGNATLPPPPPYSQTYTAPMPAYNINPAYPAPPPYPGSPLPGSNVYSTNNAFQPSQTQMTSHAQNSSDMAYPPPPVS